MTTQNFPEPRGCAEFDYPVPFADMQSDDIGAARGTARTHEFDGTPLHREPCAKCHGTARFTSWAGRDCGPCFACKGRGFNEYATPAPARAIAREQARARADVRSAQAIADWAAQFPAEHAWINANPGFDFAVAMAADLAKYGSLTPNKTAAIQRCMARDVERAAARAAEQAQQAARTAPVEAARLEAAFAAAMASGLKRPRITLTGFGFSLARASSANAGAIYVKAGETYLGKVRGGQFTPSRECAPAQQAEVAAVLADPMGAAESYGRLTGNCCICSRLLTDPESVARGIGPVCARRFGW